MRRVPSLVLMVLVRLFLSCMPRWPLGPGVTASNRSRAH